MKSKTPQAGKVSGTGKIYIHRSVYHDHSTKGFRHNIKHKRHDCWRADYRVSEKQPAGTTVTITQE